MSVPMNSFWYKLAEIYTATSNDFKSGTDAATTLCPQLSKDKVFLLALQKPAAQYELLYFGNQTWLGDACACAEKRSRLAASTDAVAKVVTKLLIEKKLDSQCGKVTSCITLIEAIFADAADVDSADQTTVASETPVASALEGEGDPNQGVAAAAAPLPWSTVMQADEGPNQTAVAAADADAGEGPNQTAVAAATLPPSAAALPGQVGLAAATPATRVADVNVSGNSWSCGALRKTSSVVVVVVGLLNVFFVMF